MKLGIYFEEYLKRRFTTTGALFIFGSRSRPITIPVRRNGYLRQNVRIMCHVAWVYSVYFSVCGGVYEGLLYIKVCVLSYERSQVVTFFSMGVIKQMCFFVVKWIPFMCEIEIVVWFY